MKILKVGSKNCEGCKVMGPLFKEIEAENPNLKTEYFECENCKKIVDKYDIESAPTFIFVDKEENELDRLVGVHTKEEVTEKIEKYKDK